MSRNVVEEMKSIIDSDFGFVKFKNESEYFNNPRTFTSGDQYFKFMRLSSSNIDIRNEMHAIMIHSDYCISVTIDMNTTTYKNGNILFFYSNEFVSIHSVGELNLLYIDRSYYSPIEAKIGLIKKFPYEELISDLFRSINLQNKGMYQCRAIANLIAASIDKVEFNSDYEKIIGYMKKNFRNQLSIKILAKEIGMSVRKVQYVLSENKTSFADILNELRVDDLKFLIDRNPRRSISCLSKESGFSSISTANRAFEKSIKMRISVYKKDVMVS